MRIILASTSPRRRELLERTGVSFEVVPSSYEEDMTLPMPPTELAQCLGRGKAIVVARQYPDAVVVGCDTFVVLENQIIGKPKTAEEAENTLRILSGRPHVVMSGLAVIHEARKKESVSCVQTTVWFRSLSEKDIDDYVATGEPLGKAGSYAIQGKGGQLIEKIEGNYDNVMGLPVSTLIPILKDFGVGYLP